MAYIALVSIIALLALQWSGSIPEASVGGSLTIGFALILAALAVGVHEAWRKRRGVLGWIVNIVVSFIGLLLVAPPGGALLAIALSPFTSGRSLAASGGLVLSVAIIGITLVVIGGAWAALHILNRWR